MAKNTTVLDDPKRSYYSTGEYLAAKKVELSPRLGTAFGNLTGTIAHFMGKHSCRIRVKKENILNPPEHLEHIVAKGYQMDTLDNSLVVWKKLTKSFKNLQEWTIAPITLQGVNSDSQGMYVYYRADGEVSLNVTKYRLGFFFNHFKPNSNYPAKTRVIPGQIRKQLTEILSGNATDEEIKNLSVVIEAIAKIVGMEVILEEPTIQLITSWKTKCKKCGGIIPLNEEVNWKRGYGVWHITCPAEPQLTPTKKSKKDYVYPMPIRNKVISFEEMKKMRAEQEQKAAYQN